MIKNLLLLALVIATLSSCSKSTSCHERDIGLAEKLMESYPDSALAILEAIDPAELTVDSLKAKYFYVRAFINNGQSHPLLSDSLISFSTDYYRGRDLKRSIRSATLLAAYKFITGEKNTALRMLDSLSTLPGVPDSLLIEPLRQSVELSAYDRDNEENIRRLIAINKSPEWNDRYKYWLYFGLIYNGKIEEALEVIDELANSAASGNDERQRFIYEYEKLDALVEANRYEETLSHADTMINMVNEESIVPYILLWKSLAKLNNHDYAGSALDIARGDSLISNFPAEEKRYFSNFSLIVNTVLDYHKTGRVSILVFSKLVNSQRDNLFEARDLQEEANRHALKIENQRLMLKAKTDRQTATIIILILAALILCGVLAWYAYNKRRKALEFLERNEILQKLVEESKATKTDEAVSNALRKVLLQQLGIIRMVAQTPTEQNREMLRKISSLGSGKDSGLVDWETVYGLIDNLYSGFYSRLHQRHGAVLTEKEEQIIALMSAGFSTKEIGVITGQSAATVYVRKSAVRKKLGVPEKEDIIAFLHMESEE